MSRRLALVVCSTFVCALTPALGCGDDGGGGSADGTVLQDTGGSDATAPTDTGGGGDTTAPTDTTVTDTATPDGTGPVDTSTPPDTSPPTWSITTSALTPTSACPGAEITLTATLVGDYPDPATVRVELSSPGGSFGSPRDLGTGTITGGSGEVTVTLPGDVTASTGYAVRVGAVGALGDDGEDLVVFAGPEFDLFFPKSYGTVRTTYTVSNDSTGDSWLWDLGPDATPSSSDDAEPTWTYATSGSKDVTLTITTADGCSATQTFPAANTVLGCDSAIGAGASVHREVDGSLDTGAEHWLCAGSSVEDGGGRRLVHVEPGATFDYRGGGTYGVVVRAGGAYRGSERVALVYETGADVRPDATIADAVECDTLTVDLSAAPANGCVTAGAPAVTATLGPVGAGPHCPGGELELAFVASAAPQTANRYLVQLSDDAGDFAGGEIVAQLASAAISGTIAVDLPAALESDGTYYVRLITTDPVSVSEPVGPLAVPALATADFSRSAGAPFVDEAVTFTDTTTGAHSAVHWDFGADATPATSTAASPSVTWSTPGVKTITFTATDASGCPISRTKSNVTVIGCTAQLPATTTLVTGQDNAFNGAGDTLVCGGADLTVFNAARTYYVMPGGKVRMVTGNLSGATFYVQGGGVFDGPSVNGGGDVVVAGAGRS
ncbi:MAG: hypothetical protein H6745_20585 [Deltaproteobacteria bacterium]|nr:hypothetical protein [Deltaproteobacteria bacterium]